MPNHFHLVVQLAIEAALSRFEMLGIYFSCRGVAEVLHQESPHGAAR